MSKSFNVPVVFNVDIKGDADINVPVVFNVDIKGDADISGPTVHTKSERDGAIYLDGHNKYATLFFERHLPRSSQAIPLY